MLADANDSKLHTLKVRLQRRGKSMHISSDRLSQSDRAGYRMNHSPFVCRHVNRGRSIYILRGSPTIPSMIPMVLSDNTPTGCSPHGQTALTGILPTQLCFPRMRCIPANHPNCRMLHMRNASHSLNVHYWSRGCKFETCRVSATAGVYHNTTEIIIQ